VIATPGRLMDFIQQKVIDVRVLDFFILDEVDRMLDMGFVRDITKIWKSIKNLKQTFTFSATMNPEMKAIITDQIHDYKFIKVGEEVTVDKIDHSYMKIRHEDKFINLIKLLRDHKGEKAIVFTHTKRNTDTIHKILQGEGFSIGMLNGDMSQNKRLKALE
jgi:ATP-dependent RNA helicase RhlE